MTTIADRRDDYMRDGVIAPVPLLSESEAADHRSRLEAAEAEMGNLHYINKIHTAMRSPYELTTHPAVLDVVEAIIGPDILLYSCLLYTSDAADE